MGMHRTGLAWIVGVSIHILGEHSGTRHVRLKEPVAELVGVESLREPRHVAGSMVLDVNLPHGTGRQCGHTRIDPELRSDSTSLRNSGRARGWLLAPALLSRKAFPHHQC